MPFPRDIGFLLFRLVFPALIIAMQYMLYRKASRWFRERPPENKGARRALATAFIVFNAALVAVAVFRPVLPEMSGWFKYLGAYPFFVWHGATFFIGLVIIVSTLLSLPVKFFAWAYRAARRFFGPSPSPATVPAVRESVDTSRRVFLRRSMYGLTAVSFAGSSYGVVFGRTSCEITRTDIALAELPPGLEGLTIGLISDIHSSAFMPKHDMQRYVEVMNSLGVDLIVVTGDFVNSVLEEVYPFAEAFSDLRAPLGVYGVLGNHDFFSRRVDLVAKAVDDCGVKLLRNDRITIERNGARLLLLGVDDVGRPAEASEAMTATLRGAPDGMPRILLCHRPYFLSQAVEHSMDLVLSGHTHGGQVSLGSFGGTTIAPASLASKYVWGSYREGKTQMYVNRGIGTVGLPIRINCPPEITVLRLTGGAPAAFRVDDVVRIS